MLISILTVLSILTVVSSLTVGYPKVVLTVVFIPTVVYILTVVSSISDCSQQHHSPRSYWASEASPTLGCSIEISRDIYMSVGRSVCLSWSKKRRRKYVDQTRACSKSVLGGKIRPVTPVLLISTIRYSSFSTDGRETFT